ncbi:MAG TPA: MerR family transcriptional regulator [Clostridiales bacterium]|nr:MerR family transcriptional regulator [Clostridiales bacterium]
MIKEMSPVEVRDLLGISRSAIRYYTERGLISSKKHEHNGYSYYSGADLLELIDVAFFRNCLNANVDEIHDIVYAGSIDEYLEAYSRQNDLFEKEIQRRMKSLEMLRDFEIQIKHALSFQNKFTEMTLNEPVYLFYPEKELQMNIHSALFSVSYWVSKFRITGNTPIHEESPMMIGKRYVSILDKEFPSIRYHKIVNQRYFYITFTNDKEMKDPSILESVLALGKEQGVSCGEAVYIRYLLTFRRENQRSHFYEAYFPFGKWQD